MANPYPSPSTVKPAEAGASFPSPPLLADWSFLGLTATQFLGAFNDNLFKQLMLLLAIPVGAVAHEEQDQQATATIVFALPFILFSGFAGYLSDRYSKTRIIVLAKVAEILIMVLGMAAFASYAIGGYAGLLVVLFLMGTHSAFFGPGKYGILPEMLRKDDLPRANGLILMTTFLAIIFGTATAGVLGNVFIDESGPVEMRAVGLWKGSAVCVTIAVAGTLTSLLIRRLAPAQPNLPFHFDALITPKETRQLLMADRPLVLALLASCVFWLVSGIAIQAVNSLGLVQLQLDKFQTSLMTAVIGLGIAVGAVIAGRMCHGRADFRIVRAGAWGIVVFLALLAVSKPGGEHLLGYVGSFPVLVLLGAAAGFFAIPVQVFIQDRPPKDQKGRMIALMNLVNFIAILFSGVLYGIFDKIVTTQEWPRSAVFGMMAAIMLPLALLYRPRNEASSATDSSQAAKDNQL